MTNFVHFYYGDAIETFYTGIGTIIRALGHGKKAIVVITDESFDWIRHIHVEKCFFNTLLLLNKKSINQLSESFFPINSIVLFSNVDILINKKWLSETQLKAFISNLKEKNEVIVTSEKFYNQIADLADYCSYFNKINK